MDLENITSYLKIIKSENLYFNFLYNVIMNNTCKHKNKISFRFLYYQQYSD